MLSFAFIVFTPFACTVGGKLATAVCPAYKNVWNVKMLASWGRNPANFLGFKSLALKNNKYGNSYSTQLFFSLIRLYC